MGDGGSKTTTTTVVLLLWVFYFYVDPRDSQADSGVNIRTGCRTTQRANLPYTGCEICCNSWSVSYFGLLQDHLICPFAFHTIIPIRLDSVLRVADRVVTHSCQAQKLSYFIGVFHLSALFATDVYNHKLLLLSSH